MRRLAMAGLLAALSLPWGCGNNGSSPSSPGGGSPPYTYPFSFIIGDYATAGSGNGQFNGPEQIAVYNNTLYVVDNGNGRVEKLDLSGNGLGAAAVPGASFLWGIAAGKSGVLFVSDEGNGNIYELDSNLNLLGNMSPSIAPNNPGNMAVDSTGRVYFTNYGNNTLQRCDSDGTSCVTVGGAGTTVGQLGGPVGVALDANGNVYVAEQGNNRVQKFSPALGSPSVIINPGTANGSVSQCQALGVDSDGNLLVGDAPVVSGPSRLQKFSSSGSFIQVIAPPGNDPFGYNTLVGIAFDSNKDVFVSDYTKNAVFKFAPY